MEWKTIKFGTFALAILCVAFLISLEGMDDNSDTADPALPEDQHMPWQAQGADGGSSQIDVFDIGTRSAPEDDPCYSCHKFMEVMMPIIMDYENSSLPAHDASCIDCHEAEPTDVDAIDHNGYYMSPVVSPKDCGECHPKIAQEFEQSLHSFGVDYYEYLYDREKLPYLESQVDSGFLMVGDEEMEHAATLRGCQGCHGTNMTGKSVEDFTVWPNNGIGRINPDGSKGSCVACHTRHRFSVEEARKPETCGQCHLGPDHPQIEMYEESKHGNIYASEGDTWNWTAKNWTAGDDYRAPTCVSCHMGETDQMAATHDVSSRLSWELESPVSRRTDGIANSLGVPFGDGTTWQVKRSRMESVCKQCHGPTWAENYFMQADVAVDLYNEQYLAAKATVDLLYADGLLTPESFDEPIEFEIYEMWHHEGRRARMGAFMMAPDYVQWHGFYDLLIDKVEIEHMDKEIRAQHAEMTKEPESVFLATNGFDGNIYLRWAFFDAEGVDHYDLYWSTTAIPDLSAVNPQANVTDDLYTVEGLTANTTYYFYVEAVLTSGEILASSDAEGTPTIFQSSEPADLTDIEEKNTDQDQKIADQEDSVTTVWTGLVIGLVVVLLLLMLMGYHGMTNIRSEIATLRDDVPGAVEKSIQEKKSKDED